MSLKIWSHNPGSHTAIELAARLRCRVLADAATSRWTPQRGDTIINYGNSDWSERITSQEPYRSGCRILNHPVHVNELSDKLQCLQLLDVSMADEDYEGGANVIPYTFSRDKAELWLIQGYDIVCRHKLRGHSGAGIEIITAAEYKSTPVLPACSLYTKYIKKNAEHRVHMFRNHSGGTDFIWQQKRRRYDCIEPNWAVRNYENGFIYAIDDVIKPAGWEAVEQLLASAVMLDFCAADLITPNSTNTAAVRALGPMLLEINTAPGLQSETLLSWYVDHFQKRIKDAKDAASRRLR